MKITCAICDGDITPGDPWRADDDGRLIHVACDPSVTRCPHCGGAL